MLLDQVEIHIPQRRGEYRAHPVRDADAVDALIHQRIRRHVAGVGRGPNAGPGDVLGEDHVTADAPDLVQRVAGLGREPQAQKIAPILESILGFLGAGIPPEIPSWGNIMAEGRTYFQITPWIIFFPGVALAITVLAVNIVGDGLRDTLDPRIARKMGN